MRIIYLWSSHFSSSSLSFSHSSAGRSGLGRLGDGGLGGRIAFTYWSAINFSASASGKKIKTGFLTRIKHLDHSRLVEDNTLIFLLNF